MSANVKMREGDPGSLKKSACGETHPKVKVVSLVRLGKYYPIKWMGMIFPFPTYGVDFDIIGQSHKVINAQSACRERKLSLHR